MKQETVMRQEPVFKQVQEADQMVLKASYSFRQQEEYKEAQINGFKGTIEEYFSVRDYT